MKKEGIEINGYKATWYVTDEIIWRGKKRFLLENEVFGDEAPGIIVDEQLNIILDDVWNGFLDLENII